MRKALSVAVGALVAAVWIAAPAEAAEHRIGVGANYWKTVDNIDSEDFKNIDEHGLSWLATYQFVPAGIFKFEADVEYFPDLGIGDKKTVAPQVFALVGGTLYAGAGAGIFYSDGDWADNPYFILRAGLDLQILPFLYLDINANYRFNDWDSLKGSDIKTSTVTLGAAARIAM